MAKRDLNHSRVALTENAGLKRKGGGDVEVWNDICTGEHPHITLVIPTDESWEAVDLTPNEARAVAYLLISAAADQDARSDAGRAALTKDTQP